MVVNKYKYKYKCIRFKLFFPSISKDTTEDQTVNIPYSDAVGVKPGLISSLKMTLEAQLATFVGVGEEGRG